MKLLFDQNLSYRLVSKVSEVFPESMHVAALNLDRSSDQEVWEYAKNNNFIIVTKDSDFNEISTYYGFPPHIIWLRMGNGSVDKSATVLLSYSDQIVEIVLGNQTGIIEVIA
jgi:predicted nuclease of predicted toxin-antitoxin system